jgi:hypothetical protein
MKRERCVEPRRSSGANHRALRSSGAVLRDILRAPPAT